MHTDRDLIFKLCGALTALVLGACTKTLPITSVDYRLPPAILAPLEAAGVRDESQAYADLFCSVLEHIDETTNEWGDCDEYLEVPGTPAIALEEIPTDYRVLVISGILSQCVSQRITAFSRARRHLQQEHGLTAEYLDVPAFGSSEYNGRVIADYLKAHYPDDPRPYILVGFSKGTPDILEGLAQDPEASEAVAALITVAGAIGGSRAVDPLEETITELIGALEFGDCERADNRAFESLRRPVRQEFLENHPLPLVRAYSLVGVSTPESTSAINRPTWELLAKFALEQDGQVIAYEAIVPGGTFLGAARADHWALAMPFEHLNDPVLDELIDRNHFPREALLEAAIRFVLRGLGAT